MITVLGSINMDLVANTPRLPEPGETVSGTGFSTAAGGKGANQALAARRAGSLVRMAGAVGTDKFADAALELLEEAGVDLSAVARSDQPTGTALILVGGNGENMIAVVPGANGTIETEAADEAVTTTRAGGILMLQLEIPAESVESALRTAHARHIVSILNTAPLTPEAPELAKLADIVIANETEFELLIGKPIASASEREAEMLKWHIKGNQTLIVTLGSEGVIAVRNNVVHTAAGLDIVPVDTVGAGDTFCGYLASALEQGLDFPDALRRAAVAGSLACLKAGAQPSIPTAGEVEAYL